ncbi:universal stress protein [Lentzea sp. NBC_00516]|jgi:nucleotide-binding universal stress UspA family protein|uniref:Universal stress protein n=1 Tax=Lentzea sokolovensis TaxID=3095429 RepID=A0ABU4UPL7_9PSEU|nr:MULTISPECIES: universal stress protein [unclassified Lentzea]MDX8141419.1 universal stress protein [Lentzea sp. BCCO 10_0061]WUD27242.1 universal stress protein [Lentzea sp. NBC_00516]
MRTPVILVGVDGSPESRAALRWALEEAPHRGARVEAMLVHQQEPAFVPATSMGFNPHGEMPQRHPARELHDAVQHVRATMPDAPDVTETVVVGDAADHLAAASKHAELIVIGNRGRGRVAEFVSTGVTADCVRHATCPVVVIPSKRRS